MTGCSKIFTNPLTFGIRPTSRPPSIPIFQSLFRPRQPKSGYFARRGSIMAENHGIEYNWIKGVETLEKYQPGGYHPIRIGDVLNDRYRIADKLGFGGH